MMIVTVSIIMIVTGVFAMLWCLLILYRNRIVYRVRIEVIEKHFEKYDSLPSYDKMLRQLTKWKLEDWIDV